jgi:molecular chaperone Hsp33
MPDILIGASTEAGTLLVRAASTGDLCERARLLHGTSPTATAALGRALTATLLFACLLKDRQSILLQWRGNGPLGPVVAEGWADLSVRGYVSQPRVDLPSKEGKLDVGGAVGRAGTLVVIKDLGLKEPYISTGPLRTGEMGDDLAYYLATSEQTPSAVALGVHVHSDHSVGAAGGILVETLPGADRKQVDRVAENLGRLGAVTRVLLEGYGVEGLLGRALEGVPFQARRLGTPRFECNCGPDRLDATLAALGREEARDILDKEGELRVQCAFCAADWRKGALQDEWEKVAER